MSCHQKTHKGFKGCILRCPPLVALLNALPARSIQKSTQRSAHENGVMQPALCSFHFFVPLSPLSRLPSSLPPCAFPRAFPHAACKAEPAGRSAGLAVRSDRDGSAKPTMATGALAAVTVCTV